MISVVKAMNDPIWADGNRCIAHARPFNIITNLDEKNGNPGGPRK
jgi:hypothetical protein